MDRDGERERERERRSSTCPPLSPSPHTNSFVIGTAVINTHTESEGCSPVSGGRTIRLCPTSTSGRHWCRGSRRSPPPSLQWCRRLSAFERVLNRWSSGRWESNLRTQTKCPRPQISHISVKSHSGIAPDPSFQPRVGSLVSPRMDTYPKGLVHTQHPAVLERESFIRNYSP